MKHSWAKASLITQLILIFLLSNSSLNVNSTTTILRISIVGANSSEFIPGPCPPGDPCTYDSLGAYGVIFRLTYQGESQCNITNIRVWQKVFGSYFAGPATVSPPEYTIPPDKSFEFLVKETFVFGEVIEVNVQTLEEGEVNLSVTLTTPISWIPNWTPPPQPTMAGIINITLVPISAGMFVSVILVRRWTYNQKGQKKYP